MNDSLNKQVTTTDNPNLIIKSSVIALILLGGLFVFLLRPILYFAIGFDPAVLVGLFVLIALFLVVKERNNKVLVRLLVLLSVGILLPAAFIFYRIATHLQ